MTKHLLASLVDCLGVSHYQSAMNISDPTKSYSKDEKQHMLENLDLEGGLHFSPHLTAYLIC